MDSYLEHRRQSVGSLLRALEQGEFEHIQNVAHDLVGTGASFGFEDMSLIGRSLESAALGKQVQEIKILVNGLAEYLSRVEVVYE
ncbi:MAG: Hpt domain-containing protein [Chloroflexi bacterium]|nr:Hpt domain-containing protein [Chloroflexota bacterium]MDA1271004.1 Hpt domain-containing protein [Chloroflexota bacterium]